MITLDLTLTDPMENEKNSTLDSNLGSCYSSQQSNQYTRFDFFFLTFSDFSPIWDMISIFP